MAKSRFDRRGQPIPESKFDQAKDQRDPFHWPDKLDYQDNWPEIAKARIREILDEEFGTPKKDEPQVTDVREDAAFLRQYIDSRSNDLQKGTYDTIRLPSGRTVRVNGYGSIESGGPDTPTPRPDPWIRPIAPMRRPEEIAGADLALASLVMRLGGVTFFPEDELRKRDWIITQQDDYAEMRKLLSIKPRDDRTVRPHGPAADLFAFADELDGRATDASPHEAGVYADIADEMRKRVRKAFGDLLTSGMLEMAEKSNRVKQSSAHGLPDQFWQEIPRKYVAAACDKKTNAWYAYTTTDLEWSGASGTWVPTATAREKNEKVVVDIEHIGDDVSIPCFNHRESLTIRPGHVATTQE